MSSCLGLQGSSWIFTVIQGSSQLPYLVALRYIYWDMPPQLFCSLQPQYIQQFSCLTAYCLSPLLEVNIKSRVLSPISFQTLLKYHLLWGQYPTNTCLKVRISQSSITALLMVQLLLGHFVRCEIYVSALNQLM